MSRALRSISGRYASISEIRATEKMDRGYVAPDIVEAILDGRQPEGFALSDLLQPFPLEWELQRAKFAIKLGASTARPADYQKGIEVSKRTGV